MTDFTLKIYEAFLSQALQNGYTITSVKDYFQNPNSNQNQIIFRHDVDKKPFDSLQTAEIENAKRLKSTYWFRIVKENNNFMVINKIV